jgi:hypothetical protein
VKLDVENNGTDPLAFRLGQHRLAVTQVIDRWPAEDYAYFKIEADDGATYILRHDDLADEWELTLYQSPPR